MYKQILLFLFNSRDVSCLTMAMISETNSGITPENEKTTS